MSAHTSFATSAAAPLTIRRKLAALSSFYRFLQDTGKVASNADQGVPLPKKWYK